MGDKLRTMQNIEIIKTDLENELTLFKRDQYLDQKILKFWLKNL